MLYDNRNVFQIYKNLNKVPFAVSRKNWADYDLVIVTKVIPNGEYGKAYGFPVRNGVPNNHFAYDKKWSKEMEMPNAGCYQWRIIDISDIQIKKIIENFYETIAKRFGFISPAEDRQREEEYLQSLIKISEQN